MRYRPNVESLSAHSTPGWWRDAKLGLMVHWGLYSVPAWAPADSDILSLLRDRPDDALSLTPYAEWYENSLKFPDGPTAAWHRRHWGERSYDSFKTEFEAGLGAWSPDPLLDLAAASGARYLVPVTKHHDGYCLWPTALDNPARGAGWRTRRDIVGELAAGARARGLAFGVYYSGGLDWTLEPRPIPNLATMRIALPAGSAARALILGHYRELIERYDPDILWNDIGYPDSEDLWGLLADFYNDRDERLVNDRFQLPSDRSAALRDAAARAAYNRAIADAMATPGFAFAPSLPPVWDHRTPEYAAYGGADTPWETVRGVGHSFGFNQAETDADHLDGPALIRLFAGVVGDGGNLLINVGPRADGSIPEAQAAPLRALGAWIAEHAPAIYGTRVSRGPPPQEIGSTPVKFVEGGGRRFAILAGPPPAGEQRLVLGDGVHGLGWLNGQALPARREGETIVVTFRPSASETPASVLEIV
jgi:alpha-L-fucosidase